MSALLAQGALGTNHVANTFNSELQELALEIWEEVGKPWRFGPIWGGERSQNRTYVLFPAGLSAAVHDL